MTSQRQYWERLELEQIYLEDSYVLSIEQSTNVFEFKMELVLRENHPLYEAPTPDEQYCYRQGTLTFRDVTEVRWLERRNAISMDARGQADMGNIDALYEEAGWFKLQGDWGKVQIRAGGLDVQF